MENTEIKNIALIYWGKSRELQSDNKITIDNLRSAIEKLGYICKLYR
jgi:D-alanine-D-alanine ligase